MNQPVLFTGASKDKMVRSNFRVGHFKMTAVVNEKRGNFLADGGAINPHKLAYEHEENILHRAL
jgi:predicted aspartyl protease